MAITDSTPSYEIVTAVGEGEFYGRMAGDWDADPVGAENQFDTIDAASAAIADLRATEGFEDSIYAVRQIGKRYPEIGTIDQPQEEPTMTCAYCNHEVPGNDPVPAYADDAAWAEMAERHADDCEWIATRAHRSCSYESN